MEEWENGGMGGIESSPVILLGESKLRRLAGGEWAVTRTGGKWGRKKFFYTRSGDTPCAAFEGPARFSEVAIVASGQDASRL